MTRISNLPQDTKAILPSKRPGGPARILYCYPYLNYDTGSPKALVQFIDLLDRDLFTPVFSANGHGPLTEILAGRGVEVIQWPIDTVYLNRPITSLCQMWRQAALLRKFGIDLVHANCFPWNADLLLGAAIVNIPVILHVHNAMDVAFGNLVRFAARKVLFCSEALMRSCAHFERVASKAEVLHNIIDVQSWSRRVSIRQSLGIGSADIAIGTVAQISHRKGIDILLETARELLRKTNDLIFLIVGPKSEREADFADTMFTSAQDPVFRGRVRFLGSRPDIRDIMASLDLFFLPSRAEPFGIVVLEAMAAGVPVVAGKIGGIPEILTSPEIGTLVDPVTPETFANAIEEVLARPDRGRSMGMKGQASLRGRFDTDAGKHHLERIYLEVLERT